VTVRDYWRYKHVCCVRAHCLRRTHTRTHTTPQPGRELLAGDVVQVRVASLSLCVYISFSSLSPLSLSCSLSRALSLSFSLCLSLSNTHAHTTHVCIILCFPISLSLSRSTLAARISPARCSCSPTSWCSQVCTRTHRLRRTIHTHHYTHTPTHTQKKCIRARGLIFLSGWCRLRKKTRKNLYEFGTC
jgi:hypothetical protein